MHFVILRLIVFYAIAKTAQLMSAPHLPILNKVQVFVDDERQGYTCVTSRADDQPPSTWAAVQLRTRSTSARHAQSNSSGVRNGKADSVVQAIAPSTIGQAFSWGPTSPMVPRTTPSTNASDSEQLFSLASASWCN